MSETVPRTFEAFQSLLADVLQIDAARLRPDAYFITDLGVDSLRMLHVLFRMEEMGIRVPLEAAWKIQTVEDAYRVYLELLQQAGL